MTPFDLDLPARWKAGRWKVNIRDNETIDEPHVTILRGPDVWRVSLRDGRFPHSPVEGEGECDD